jgi:uncharacterized protein (TIGR00251 family)
MITAAIDGIYLDLHVQPGARRPGIVGPHGDALKVAVSAPAVSGRANQAVLLAVSALFDVPIGDVSLTSGHRSRRKRVFIRGIDEPFAKQRIGESTL